MPEAFLHPSDDPLLLFSYSTISLFHDISEYTKHLNFSANELHPILSLISFNRLKESVWYCGICFCEKKLIYCHNKAFLSLTDNDFFFKRMQVFHMHRFV